MYITMKIIRPWQLQIIRYLALIKKEQGVNRNIFREMTMTKRITNKLETTQFQINFNSTDEI